MRPSRDLSRDLNFDINNSINYLIKSSKNLTALRKKGLLMIQFDNHVIINSNPNELNLTFILSFQNVINFENFENLKI